MIKNVMDQIADVGVYGIVSLLIFFGFFTGMLIWAFRLKKPYLSGMRQLPLDSESISTTQKERHEREFR